MGVKVVLTNKSQQTGNLTSVSTTTNNDIQISRFIYQQLRSLAKNKNFVNDYTNGLLPPAFVKLVNEFEKKHRGEDIDEATQKLDEYLGSLGLSETYPFVNDKISIDQWIDYAATETTRNVINTTNNIVIIVGGIEYNVVHSLEEVQTAYDLTTPAILKCTFRLKCIDQLKCEGQ